MRGHHLKPVNITLETAIHSKIKTYCKRSLNLNLGLCRKLSWNFVVADVKFPILGADFLLYYGLLVDIQHSKLLDATTFLSVNGTASQIQSISPIIVEQSKSKYLNLLAEFPSITKPVTQETSVKHQIIHHIVTEGQTSLFKAPTTCF